MFDPAQISYETLLKLFWEGHDPTQGMRQGNDLGTQYRSAIYYRTTRSASSPRRPPRPGDALEASRYGDITTEIAPLADFYYAEDYHQQYLAKVPGRLLRHRRHRGVTARSAPGCGPDQRGPWPAHSTKWFMML